MVEPIHDIEPFMLHWMIYTTLYTTPREHSLIMVPVIYDIYKQQIYSFYNRSDMENTLRGL
jgi:hypothetical protein